MTAGELISFSTLNGKVDATFPGSIKAAIKMKSGCGDAYSGFDVAVDKGAAKVTRTTPNGISRLSTDGWTCGKVNGSGPKVLLKTFNGDIFLRKAK